MRILRLACVLVAATAVGAQSPLTTTFVNNNGGSVGGGVYYNLTVNPPGITITGLDTNLNSAASTVGSIDVFVISGGTHVGNETNIGAWTQVGTGTVTSAGPGQPSAVTLAAPIPLVAATYGVALRHNGVAAAYTNGTGANQMYSTAEATLNAGSANNTAFSTAPFSPRVWNGRITYNIGTGGGAPASVTLSGTGCVSSAVSFYELFQANTFDLGNTSLMMVPSGSGYTVTAGTATFVAPTSVGLGLTDDSLSAALNLPFTFNYPGGSTPQIKICSNGFIYLNGTGTSTSFTPTVTDALTGGPRLFCPWSDWLPDGATNTNNVFFDVDPSNTSVRCTWNNVPEFGSTGVGTFQVVINASGIVEYVWQAVSVAAHTPIVGFSPGAANRDPGNRDISATLPFSTRADTTPLAQNAGRPVIGTTINLTVSNIPGGSLAGLELIGLNSGGIDLTGAGAPGCSLYVLPILGTIVFGTGSPTATIPVGIPNDPSLVGGSLPIQAAVVNLAINSLGVITSNLATLNFGNL